MSAPREATHWEDCWRVHDDCAMLRAKRVLEASLLAVNFGISDHAGRPCPAPEGDCHAVRVARVVLHAARGLPS